jgi:hypothetical protein
MHGKRARRGLVVYQLVLIILLIIVIILVVVGLHSRRATVTSEAGQPGALATRNGLPVMPAKPTPREITFDGCPPDGDGSDRQLNQLKNRVDDGNYVPVPFAAIDTLPWPRSVDRVQRVRWSAADREAVSRYEGLPVSVEGYLAGAKVEGPESPNCHGADPKYRDWHVWLVGSPGADRSTSIVVEATPRVRAERPGWRISELTRAVREKSPVRISGWLMLDPEHPEQLGKTRGTLWEIHPIMKIEVQRGGKWVDLENQSRVATHQ